MSYSNLRKGLLILFVFCSAIAMAQNNTSLSGKDFTKDFSTQDTIFKAPYIDVDEWRDKPVRHHYVHGGFKGTDTRFSFYFPTKEKYEGHFFQYITPVPDNENLSQNVTGEEDKIGFSIASGAYFIETNGGGRIDFSKPNLSSNPTIGAYRANAACAQFSKIVAAQIYNQHRVYGYCFGGSGGAYRTIGSMENTEGVWDGAVPFVIGSPMAIPNVFTVRMHAMRVLKDKFPQINDALEPGGSGDMYAGLNDEEKEALQEVTRMGFPPKSWFAYKTMGLQAFPVLYQAIVSADRKYFDDFWKVQGYLGANPPASLLKARIQKVSTIKNGIAADDAIKLKLIEPISEKDRGSADLAWKNQGQKPGTMPVAFQLEDELPDVGFLGGDLIIKSGAAAGKTLELNGIKENKVILNNTDAKLLALIKEGDTVQVDNSNFLAAQTYHRHQVPKAIEEYPEWKQFVDATGKPMYPQRPMLLGPSFTKAASGVLPSGKFKGKMIVVESMWDREAYPWQADWYRNKVKENFGDSTDNYFRLWYTDHAVHGDVEKPDDPTHIVSYLGVLRQALRDLSAWVEKGIPPPATTNYTIEDGQVVVPATAAERKGIQPVVTLKANGSERADIRVGEAVTFTAVIEVPPNAGKVVAAQWDFEGEGTFAVEGKLIPDNKNTLRVTLKTTHTFTKPGTYFTILKGVSQRQGDAKTPYARIQNLERVRVVVK